MSPTLLGLQAPIEAYRHGGAQSAHFKRASSVAPHYGNIQPGSMPEARSGSMPPILSPRSAVDLAAASHPARSVQASAMAFAAPPKAAQGLSSTQEESDDAARMHVPPGWAAGMNARERCADAGGRSPRRKVQRVLGLNATEPTAPLLRRPDAVGVVALAGAVFLLF